MGQKDTKYLKYIDESDIIVSDPKLEVRQSTIENGGNGVFAMESVLYDVKEDVISRYINDLTYTGNAHNHELLFKITDNVTNIGYVRPTSKNRISNNEVCYCIAIKDIPKGQELSRFYGSMYWFNHEFNKKYKMLYLDNNKLPPVYVFIDTYWMALMANTHYYIFGKCNDDKYYYVRGVNVSENDYLNVANFNSLQIFESEDDVFTYIDSKYEKYSDEYYNFKCLINCSKPDLSEYKPDEKILGFKRAEYLQSDESMLIRLESGEYVSAIKYLQSGGSAIKDEKYS